VTRGAKYGDSGASLQNDDRLGWRLVGVDGWLGWRLVEGGLVEGGLVEGGGWLGWRRSVSSRSVYI
jgi:hypothetical protein